MFVSSRRIDWYAIPSSVIRRNLDLSSKFWPWPFEIKSYIFESSLRETRDDIIDDYFSLLVQRLFLKEYFTRISYFTIFDLWRLNRWPEVTFYVDLIKKGVEKLSTGVICVLIAITVPDTMTRFLKNIKTSIELWPLMTSGDPNIALREKWLK